jgi:sigma-B regulation protein RsbU (phosphoserine phosphatase)
VPRGLTVGSSAKPSLGLPSERIPTVLIVDDDPHARRILAGRLRASGCRVLEAENGQQAIACAKLEKPDLVVVDWMMPGMDGTTVCAEIKADQSLQSMHLIMLTARDDTASVVEALECGADDFVAKPYEPQELIARIGAGLQTRELHRRLESANMRLAEVNANLIEHERVLQEDLTCAAQFMVSTFPVPGILTPGVQVAWRYAPSLALGGDLFNAFPVGDHLVAMYILDMSGHGVGGALRAISFSTILQTEIRNSFGATSFIGLSWDRHDPTWILTRLDRLLPRGNDGEHCTIWLGVWDRRTGVLRYGAAGHPGPVLLKADGTVEVLGMPNLPLGYGTEYQGTHALSTFAGGDRLMLYSDGLYESFNCEGNLWGMDRLVDSCRRTARLPLGTALDAIVGEVRKWQGQDGFRDDMAIMALESDLPDA